MGIFLTLIKLHTHTHTQVGRLASDRDCCLCVNLQITTNSQATSMQIKWNMKNYYMDKGIHFQQRKESIEILIIFQFHTGENNKVSAHMSCLTRPDWLKNISLDEQCTSMSY